MDEIKFRKGNHFEERLVQALITDHQFAEQMLEVLDFDYFNLEYLRELTKIVFQYHGQYAAFPSFRLLPTLIKDGAGSDLLKDQSVQYLVRIKNEPLNGDMEYIKENALDFCRKRSLATALDTCLDLIDQQKYESIVYEIQKALLKGSERDIGHVFADDDAFEKRMSEVARNPVPTPWGEINKVLKGGGVSGGELCVVLAPTSHGKSHALVDIAANAAMLGFNVAHYTFELSEVEVGSRHDSRISGIPVDDLKQHKDFVKKQISSKLKGELVIKCYPTKSATVMTIKSHLHKLAMRDFKADLLVVDYGDLMRSRNKYEQKRFEEESVYEELRGLAQELNIPIWTATQTNRSGLDADIITLNHVAECFAKAQISDLFLTMNRKKDKGMGQFGNFYLAKSRLGPDGIKFPILVNTSNSRIEVLSPSEFDENDEQDDNARLKKKFKEFRQKPTVQDDEN